MNNPGGGSKVWEMCSSRTGGGKKNHNHNYTG